MNHSRLVSFLALSALSMFSLQGCMADAANSEEETQNVGQMIMEEKLDKAIPDSKGAPPVMGKEGIQEQQIAEVIPEQRQGEVFDEGKVAHPGTDKGLGEVPELRQEKGLQQDALQEGALQEGALQEGAFQEGAFQEQPLQGTELEEENVGKGQQALEWGGYGYGGGCGYGLGCGCGGYGFGFGGYGYGGCGVGCGVSCGYGFGIGCGCGGFGGYGGFGVGRLGGWGW